MFAVGCAFATGVPVGYDLGFIVKGWVKILPFVNKRRGEKNVTSHFLMAIHRANCPQLRTRNYGK